MSATSGATYGPSTSTEYQRSQAEKASAASGKVTHTDFLKLLTKQLTTQDPLNPMQDLDFTAQLAQLQALDEQMAMTKSMQAMRVDSQLQAGTSMIGRYISGTDEAGKAANGLVKRVAQQDGNVYVELANSQRVEVGSVSNVWDNAASMFNEIASSGAIIGYWVDAGYDDAQQPVRGIVEKVEIVNGEVHLKLAGGQTVTWNKVKELRLPTEAEQYYAYPDEVRAKIEKAQGMKDMGVTGLDADGNEVNGIVAGAVFDKSTYKVSLVLYDGTEIDIDTLKGDARKPTASDAANSLKGYWASGLNGKAEKVEGIITGAKQYDDGMALVLDTGEEIYFELVDEIRDATDAEKARLTPGADPDPEVEP